MNTRRIWTIATVATVIFLVAGFIFFQPKPAPDTDTAGEAKLETNAVNKTETPPTTEAPTPVDTLLFNKDLTSENFKIKQVRFGGDTLVSGDDQEGLPIEISDIKSEVFTDKKGEVSRAIITWKSNKLTYSEIVYTKNNGQGSKTAREDGFGFNHSLVLPDLEQATGYIYQIKSKDRWNNAQTSGFYGIYSSSRAASVFELVGKAFNDIFGWAFNRNQ